MKPRIAVFGNSSLNIGHGIAADLTLAGYEVHLFDLASYFNIRYNISAIPYRFKNDRKINIQFM